MNQQQEQLMAPTRCGDANPNGGIEFNFSGACKKDIPLKDAYRCTGCGGWFHRDCIFEHFEREKNHGTAHNALARIRDIAKSDPYEPVGDILHICEEGLNRTLEPVKYLRNLPHTP